MLRISLYNIYYDGLGFIRNNKVKLILVVLLSLCGCGLGISSAYSVAAMSGFVRINYYNVVMLASGTRNFFGYFIVRLLTLVLILLVMSLLSYRFIFSLLNVVIIFMFCFQSVKTITVIILMMGFTFMPVISVCIIPVTIIHISVFSCFVVFSFQKSYEFQYYRYNQFFYCFGKMLYHCIPLGIIFLLCSLIESVLAVILTIGITI